MNTIKVQIKTVLLENCKYDIDLYNVLTKELQNDTIVCYVLSPSKIVAYVVQTDDDFGITIESNGVFHHIDDIYNKFLVDFPNVLLETLKYDDIAVEIVHNEEDEPDVSEIDLESMQKVYDTLPAVDGVVPYTEEEMAEINSNIEKAQQYEQALKDEYLENGKRVALTSLSIVDGHVMIFAEDNNIILLQDDYELSYSQESYNSVDGTVQIIRTEKPNRSRLPIEDSATDEEVLEYFKYQKQSDNVKNDIKNIIQAFDAIENNLPYKRPVEVVEKMSEHEKNVHEMEKILNSLRSEGVLDTPKQETKENVFQEVIHFVNNEDSQEVSEIDEHDLAAYSIGDTVVETVTLKVALISFNAFDEYAANHNIVGWDLFTPTTLQIKYTEDGVTSEEKIKKFHDMMNSLDIGWIQQTSGEAKFLSEFKQVLDRDVTQEFLSRVKKHNIFVRENLAKIRSALVDMEKDYEELKDEVNLTIDWENLTAFASKKERIEHRTKGVEMVFSGTNRPDANIVKVDSAHLGKDFYIPFDLITDEIREKYVLDSELLYIENVPDFAFYEVLVNGHVMIIEKTDL